MDIIKRGVKINLFKLIKLFLISLYQNFTIFLNKAKF